MHLSQYFVMDLYDLSSLKRLLRVDSLSIWEDLTLKSSLLLSKEANHLSNVNRIA